MREYDLYLPLPPGTARKLPRLKKRLAQHFGGLTFFPHENEGVWKLGGVTFKDQIVILRILAADAGRADKYLRRLKAEVEREFDQQEVLIIARNVEII
jgi:hypothetical protein